MPLNALASEDNAIVGTIDPDAYAAGTVNSAWIDAKDFHRYMAIVSVGAMVATSTLNALLQQAQDGSGTGVKAITDKAITELTAAGSDDDKQAIINLRPEELDVANAFTHFRLQMVTAVAASDSAGLVLGTSPRKSPANFKDASSVDEIVP